MAALRSSCLFALLLGACASRPVPPPELEVPSACESLPLFERYARFGMVQRLADGRVRLSAAANAHSADCGTPDCYGTQLTVVLNLSRQGTACHVRDVDVHAEDYGCGIPEDAPPRSGTFFARGLSNLADPALEKLTLASLTGDRALVILRSNLFYFDQVKPGGELHTWLPGDSDSTERCCWGASIAESRFLESETR